MTQSFEDVSENNPFIKKDNNNNLIDSDEEEELDLNVIYDPDTAPLPAHSSNVQAFFTLFKSFIGGGVFTLPFSFHLAGLGLSTIVIILSGLLTMYCLAAIIKVADSMKENSKLTLEKIVLETLGRKMCRSVEVSLLIMQFGVCIGTFIMANQFLDYSFCSYNVDGLCQNTLFKVALFAILTIPISFINNAHYFYIPSMIGGIFVLVTIASQLVYDSELISEMPPFQLRLSAHFKTFNWEQIPLIFGVSAYAFEGIGTLFSIRGAMLRPKSFPTLVGIEMLLLTIILFLFPTVCVLALGDNLPEIVLFSLPKDNAYYLFVQIGIVVSNLLTYPVQFFPAMKIMENSRHIQHILIDEQGKTQSYLIRYGLRVLLIALMILIANLAKSFNLFLNFLGSFVFTYVGFVIPMLVYNKFFNAIKSNWKLLLNWIILGISVVLGATGAIVSLIKLFEYKEKIYTQ